MEAAAITNLPDPLLAAIYQHIEAENIIVPQPGYVSSSDIGHQCELRTWLKYKYPASATSPSAETHLARFESKYNRETMERYLRKMLDIELLTRTTGDTPYRFLTCNFNGTIHGLIKNIPQAPKTWHVWHHLSKPINDFNRFLRLKDKLDDKAILEEFDYVQYCRAIVSMYYFEVPRHYLTIATTGFKKLASVRTNEDRKLARLLIDKANRIQRYVTVPCGISQKPGHHLCNMCEFSNSCPSINNITLI